MVAVGIIITGSSMPGRTVEIKGSYLVFTVIQHEKECTLSLAKLD